MTDLRIVLLGKSGVGKSSLCNTILGKDVFKVGHTANSETTECETTTRRVNGRRVTLIDTPGFFGTNSSEKNLKAEIVKCVTECAPGPHAFLIVLKVETFTEQENQVIDKINKCLGEEAFKHAVVVFTHGDQFKERMRIDGFVQQHEGLKELLNKCGYRYQVIDSKYWRNKWWRKYRDNKVQVEQLLNTIQTLASTKGLYTNEVLQAVEGEIEQKEERIRKTSRHLSKEDIREKMKRNVSNLLKEIPGVTAEEMLEALLGGPVIASVAKAITKAFEDLRIVLLGRTGVGKSSLGNTILGENVFVRGGTANSETKECQTETRRVDGRIITLIDTPGLFDTDRSEKNLKPEIVKCVTECAPGPHAFLIVLKVDRFTDQENQVIDKIKECFSEEAFRHAVVVFTHGEQLDEGMKIEEFVSQNKKLRDLLKRCSDRCHVIDNKYWRNNQQHEYRNNEVQVKELLKTIQQMADEEGLYTNEMLQAVEKKIKEEEERLRQTSPDMSEEEIREKAKRNVSNHLKKIAGVTTGVLLGALLGLPVMIGSAVAALGGAGRVEAAVAAVGGAAGTEIGLGIVAGVVVAVGAVTGGCIGYEEADQADSVRGAVVNTAKAVFDTAKEMVTKKRQSEDKMPLL